MLPTTVKSVILNGLSLVYLWAFASLYHQIPGLYSDTGIAPVRSKLNCNNSPSHCSFFHEQPSILYLLRQLPLSPVESMELACIIGILFAALSLTYSLMRNPISYLVMWYSYLSVVQVGDDFLHFQWDTLLLEAGFLAILLAPIPFLRWPAKRWLPHDNVVIFLFRWLAFRLMFASGVVKLLGQDPTWWKLSALQYHFASQCIPTPLAWFAHQLPEVLKQLSVVVTFVILIFLSFFMLTPSKVLRYIAFGGQTLLMIAIALTGNYNFFNFLSVILCISALVDTSFSSVGTHTWKRSMKFYTALRYLCAAVGLIALIAVCSMWFEIKKDRSGASSFALKLDVKAFHPSLTRYFPYILLLGIVAFGAEVVTAALRTVKDLKKEKGLKRFAYYLQSALFTFAATAVFAISLVPMTFIDNNTWEKIPQSLKDVHKKTEHFHIAHSYGLFSSMTGVGGRPEVILEGLDGVSNKWMEYEFFYKPGSVSRRPPLVSPHQPRLDWQMWFFALRKFDESPLLLSLTYRLVTNSKPVLDLLQNAPFDDRAPKFVRGTMYRYNYTLRGDGSKDWWTRLSVGEFMGNFDANNESLQQYLESVGYLLKKVPDEHHNHLVARWLRSFRKLSAYFSGVQFVYAVTISVVAPLILPKLIGKG